MSDLRSALAQTTPSTSPIDVAGLVRSARRRRRRTHALLASSAGLVVAVVAAASLMDRPTSLVQVGSPDQTSAIGRWQRASQSPLSRRSQAVGHALSDGRILVWGGFAAGTADSNNPDASANSLRDGAIFDPSENTWSMISPAPFGFRSDGGGRTTTVLRNDRLLVVTRTSTTAAAVFDVATNEWIEPPQVPETGDPMLTLSPAFDGSTVTFLGRFEATAADANDPLVHPAKPTRMAPVSWSIGSDRWTEGAAAPIAARYRAGVGANERGDRLAVWGGFEMVREEMPGLNPFLDGAVYNTATDEWTTLPDLALSSGYDTEVCWAGERILVESTVQELAPKARAALVDPERGDVRELVMKRGPQSGQDYATFECVGSLIEFADVGQDSTEPRLSSFIDASSASRTFSWLSAPESDVVSFGDRLLATSEAHANPGDRPFAAHEFDRVTGEWRSVEPATFKNRMDATVTLSGRYLLVTGGLEGRQIEPTTESWLLTLPQG